MKRSRRAGGSGRGLREEGRQVDEGLKAAVPRDLGKSLLHRGRKTERPQAVWSASRLEGSDAKEEKSGENPWPSLARVQYSITPNFFMEIVQTGQISPLCCEALVFIFGIHNTSRPSNNS